MVHFSMRLANCWSVWAEVKITGWEPTGEHRWGGQGLHWAVVPLK